MARRLLERSKTREVRRQNALLDRLTVQFRGRIKRELEAAMREMVDGWEMTHAVLMPRDFRPRMEATYQQMAMASITAFGGRILDQGKSAGLVLERKEDFGQTMRRLALDYVQQESMRRRITEVTETTRRQIINAVDAGYKEGIGTREIGQSIRGIIGDLAGFRSNMIARTETHGAANFGSDSAAKMTGLPLKREWLAAQDERTRETHQAANGQIVGQNEDFEVGGVILKYPGDPSGPANEVINCRCAVGYIVDDGLDEETPAPDLTEAPGPQFTYETARMPETVQEADAFVKEKGLAFNTRLDGFNMRLLQGAFRAALEATERFGLAPLVGIGPTTRFGVRQVKNASAAIVQSRIFDKGQIRNLTLLHLPTKFGKVSEYEANRKAAIAQAPRYRSEASTALGKLQAAGKADRRVMDRFSQMQEGDYSWTYLSPLPASEHAKVITYHEYGHVLHLLNKEQGQKINDFLAAERPLRSGWQYLVSKYAGENEKEYIAETFSIYMHAPKSQWFRIHPALLKIYQELDKKK